MNLEPEQVDEERHQYESGQTCQEVLPKLRQGQSPSLPIDVQKAPEVNCNRATDGKEREHPNIFGRYDTAHCDSSKQEPFPPFLRERLVPHFEKPDIAKDTE